MLHLRINNSDATNYLEDGTLFITDQIQNKSNTATFNLNPGATTPNENEEVVIYDVTSIVSDLTDNLAAWYRFDEGSGAIALDSSRNKLNGTITTATYTSGRFGDALDFNGVSGMAAVTDNTAIQNVFDGGGSFSAWIYPNSDGENSLGRIIDKSQGVVRGPIFYVTNDDGTNAYLKFYHVFSGGNGSWVTTSKEITLNKWNHVIVTYDSNSASNDPTLYINGGAVAITEDLTPVGTRVSDAGADLYIGNRSADNRTFDGIIDDVRLYTKILSQTEIDGLYYGGNLVINDFTSHGLSLLEYGKFRVSQNFWLDIGGSDQEFKVIEDIIAGQEEQINITLTEPQENVHSSGDLCGRKIFAGTLTSIIIRNVKKLSDVYYVCSATDYTKIFDKKLINDSWEDRDARYIINDFCNTTINYNHEIDQLDYATDGAIQAEWANKGGASPDDPVTDSVSPFEADHWGEFGVGAGGTSWWYASPSQSDVSDFTGTSTGVPIRGKIGFWIKVDDYTAVTWVYIYLGSTPGVDYGWVRCSGADIGVNNTPVYITLDLSNMTVGGPPDWTVFDYVGFTVTTTGIVTFKIAGLRFLEDNFFSHYPYVESSTAFDDARASFQKPTVFIDRLADTLGNYWYIDYNRNIRFFDRETNNAPFQISDTSENFESLYIDVDTSQLKNRQTVRGGTKTSDNTYSQVVEGDDAVREWIMKSQFENLSIYLDDGSSTDTMEAGTTTTNVKATAHGLVDGDYIVNRSRSNAVREINYVDPDNFTVEAVSGQTSGDTFSKFATAKTVGVEFLVDETTVDYVSNFNEKSIRAADSEATLSTGNFLLFTYNEIIPIRVQVQDNASITTLKTLMGGDGVFDGAVITDESLDSSQAARDRAQAEVDAYSNPIVTVYFKTNHEGLESGQIISVADTNKGINGDYIIQKIKISYDDGGDFTQSDVTCSSTLFGLIEYFQQLSISLTERLIDEDEVIDQIYTNIEGITITETNTFTPSEEASETPTITISPSETATDREMTTDPYKWQPDASDARWNLAQWG